MSRAVVVVVLTALSVQGCTETPTPVEIEATGFVLGLTYVDLNGDRRFGSSDGGIRDITVDLLWAGADETVATGTSDASGIFLFTDVEVGRYVIGVRPESLADTLVVVEEPDSVMTVAAGDTVISVIGVSYPHLPAQDVDELPVGRSVFVDGVALTAWSTFGDATIHVADSSGAIRAVRVQPTGVVAGDSVRIRGRRGIRAGRAVLDNAVAFFIQGVELPVPDTIRTGAAAGAENGILDAALVHLADAPVADTATLPTGDFVLTVDDGSGPVDVLLDRNIPFRLIHGGDLLAHTLDATGVLVPEPPGWILKPRGPDEIRLVPPSAAVAAPAAPAAVRR